MPAPISRDDAQYGPIAQGAAIAIWDEEGQRAILIRQVELARAVGALEQLPIDLVALAIDDAWRGDFAGADALIAECEAVCEATGGAASPPSRPCSSGRCAATRRRSPR